MLNKEVQYVVTNTKKEEQDAIRMCFRDNQHNLRVWGNFSRGREHICDIKDGVLILV